MSGRTRKRKQRDHHPPSYPPLASESTEPDPSLFIQAHEADVVRGPQAWTTAPTLEVRNVESTDAKSSGLMRWNVSVVSDFEEDGEQRSDSEDVVWVDRYDARLLLDALPNPVVPTASQDAEVLCSDGWSDLPSDSEDTFFFSRDETEDYHREKRRRVIDQGREERLRAILDAEHEDAEQREEDDWSGSDEEPDEAQKELMRRTATHVVTSPNAAQLEMRILANHGADRRFAFLRGRWSRAWKLAKGHAKVDMERDRIEKEQAGTKPQPATLGGLSGYGDSDSEEDSQSQATQKDAPAEDVDMPEGQSATVEKAAEEDAALSSEDAAKAARRARAREWAARRRGAALGSEPID